MSKMLGDLIQSLDIPVHYQEIHSEDQWGALRIGIIHLQIEVWGYSMRQRFDSMVEKKHIDDMGNHKAIVREEWWYPEYVEALCPGLPDWQALNRCAALFADKNKKTTKGVYYSGPWNYNDADLIRALKLDFIIERFNNSEALWQKLKQAVEQRQPIVLLNWTPNWVDARMKGKFVEFPRYSPQCESNPQWGPNPHLPMDCGNPISGWLRKAAWPGLKKRWPCVHQLMQKISLTNEMISEASALVVNDGYSEEKAAKLWQLKYQHAIVDWLDSLSCKAPPIEPPVSPSVTSAVAAPVNNQ